MEVPQGEECFLNLHGGSFTHVGTTFFIEVGRFFFMCTWVKNGYRGGDVFGCCSLGEGWEVGKKILHIKENNCLLVNKKLSFSVICSLHAAISQFDGRSNMHTLPHVPHLSTCVRVVPVFGLCTDAGSSAIPPTAGETARQKVKNAPPPPGKNKSCFRGQNRHECLV